MLNILAKALSQIDCHDETDRLICEILRALSKALDASSSTFWQYDRVTGLLSLQITCINEYGNQTITREMPQVDLPTIFSIKQYRTTRRLYFEGKPFVQVINLEDEDLRDHGEWLQSLGIKAVLQLPLIFQDNFVGWIPVHSNISQAPWSEADIQMASEMANELAIGLRIKELADQAKESVVLKERANFSREMHDTLAQDFMGILLQLEVAEEFYGKDETRFKKHLTQIRKLAERGLQEARQSIHSFRSAEAASDNLVSMIRRDLVTSYENAPVFLKEKGYFPEIVTNAKYEVYRIISEALSNAIRHSGADEIMVIFTAAPKLVIQIKDNGIGMPLLGSGQQNYGIEIMHERAHKIGAEIKIVNNSDSGTTIDIALPQTLATYKGYGNNGEN